MDTIPFAELDPGFAEYGSRLGKDFEIWYRSALPPSSLLKAQLERAGVLEYVRFVRVPLSLTGLVAEAKSLAASLAGQQIPVGVTIDTATGGVVLHPYAGSNLAERTSSANIAAATRLPFVWGDAPPAPANYGGKNLNTPLGGCTGGFVVVNGTTKRVSTAAHCGQVGDAIAYGGATGFTLKTRKYDAWYDYATVGKPTETWTADVKYADSGATRAVTAMRTWSSMNVGDPVTKYGRTTGLTGGTIQSVHSCSPAGCDPESWMVRVDPNSSYPKMCDHGDSGGPNMFNNTAYGITSGVYPDGDCTFFPIEMAIQSWGQVLLR
jgi:hypothetical protein